MVLLLPRRSTLGAMLQSLALVVSLEAVVCLLEVALVLAEGPLVLVILVVRLQVNLVVIVELPRREQVVLPLIMAEVEVHVVVDLGTLGVVVGVVVEVVE